MSSPVDISSIATTPNVKRSVAFSPSTQGNTKPRQRGNGELSPRANLRCFGSGLNFFYQINGDDDSPQRYEQPTRMNWLETLRPSVLSCGGHYTYAISDRDGGAVYRWGTHNGIVYKTPEILKFPVSSISAPSPSSSSPLAPTPSSSIPSPSTNQLVTSPVVRPRALSLASGTKHTLLLIEGGFVYGVGIGYFGQLGCGDDASSHVPKLIESLSPSHLNEDRVFSISAGGSHSGAVTKKGDIYMWGFNRSCQCGVLVKGSSTVSVPTLISGLAEVQEAGVPVQLVCGRHHSSVLTDSGAVFSWGATSFGRLGIHDLSVKKVATPKRVTTLDHFAVHALAAGDFHMLALTRDRRVFSWGYGGEGQCGHGGGLHLRTPRPIEALKHVLVSKIACAGWYSTCLSADGYLYAWGYGDGGWLGVAPPSSDPQEVSPSPSSTAAIGLSTKMMMNNKSGVDEDICSFDSAHNELVPALVTSLKEYQVTQVFCGNSHMISLSIARPEQSVGLPVSPRKRVAATPPQGKPPQPSPHLQHTPPPRHQPHHQPSQHPPPHRTTPPQHHTPPKYETIHELNYGANGGGGGGGEVDAYQQQEWYGDDSYFDANHAQYNYDDETYGAENETSISPSTHQQIEEVLDPYGTTAEQDDNNDDGGDNDEEDEALRLRRHVFSCQRHGRLEEVQKAIDDGFDVEEKDENGNTLLSIGAQNGLKGAVKLCLRNHANINAHNRTGNTALHYCFKYGHSGLGAYLIKKGADDTAINNAGLTVYEGI